MNEKSSDLLIVIDDREWVPEVLRTIVGERRYGDIQLRRQKLYDTLVKNLPDWSKNKVVHLRNNVDCLALHNQLSNSPTRIPLFIISTRAAFLNPTDLGKLVSRLPYAYEDFTDKRYQPLLVYFHDMHGLLDDWELFGNTPITGWEKSWKDVPYLEVNLPLDLKSISNFLQYSSGATETRHFNSVEIDKLYYTKSSTDRKKMEAEYRFYHLAPERMKPWFVETFDYKDSADHGSYRMMRYYFADAALQWIHEAFTAESFASFVERLMIFIADRPTKDAPRDEILKVTRSLFVDKVEKRIEQFLASDVGRNINAQLNACGEAFGIESLKNRYLKNYEKSEQSILSDSLSFGHGDPCFSNILYDQTHHFLKFIDPKGAVEEKQLWTHPIYDLCKISHSILGNYDFINNDLFQVSFDHNNSLKLTAGTAYNNELKSIFLNELDKRKIDVKIMRLCEASLFLSMLPLHSDHPNKVMAFILTAKKILDEVECER